MRSQRFCPLPLLSLSFFVPSVSFFRMSRMLSGSTRNQHDVVPPPQRITMVAASASTIIRTVPKLSIQSMTNLLAELPALPQNSTLISPQAEEPPERQKGRKGMRGK